MTVVAASCDDPVSPQPDAGDRRDAGDGGDGDSDLDPLADDDGDGLPDVFERAAGDDTVLSWRSSDTDGDGLPDGDEDPDGDGLTNHEEHALSRLSTSPPGPGPNPFRLDLLVELDSMADRRPDDDILAVVVEAYDAIPIVSDMGREGIGLQVYRDEEGLEAEDFDGSFSQRYQMLSAHPPAFTDDDDPPIPYHLMAHVMVVTARLDDPYRGGDTVGDRDSEEVENSGVLIYWDTLAEINPICGVPDDPSQPPITFEEALAATMTHELGHTLQLGHDTDAGGGVNYWNIMSVPDTCSAAQMRFHGFGNHDAALGNTEEIQAPRFSNDVVDLISLSSVLSVHSATFEDGDDGYEM